MRPFPFRKLLLVGVGVLALHGVQACSTETELNPQPLPPQGGEPAPPPGPADKTGASGGASGGTPAAPAQPAQDAGTEGGDAADAGDG